MRRQLLPILILLALICSAAEPALARPPWPSLAEQLAADRVPPGSALARLIARNQDFQMLRSEEVRDKAGVPPWLRVLWRKSHADDEYSAANPTGGYPLALKDVYEWLVHHPDLRPAEPGADAAAAHEKAASAGENIRISGEQIEPRAESDIRVNYWNPSRIIASSNELSGHGRMAIHYSADGGATWNQSKLPPVADDHFQSDPAVDWTSDGTAWATAIGVVIGSDDLTLKLRTFKSSDGGANWQSDDTISGEQTGADRQMVWTDHGEHSPFKDNVYVIWHNGAFIYVNRRTGPTGAWGEPLRVSAGETLYGIGSDIKTNGAGTVFAFWPDPALRRIFFSRSTNGGASFSKPIRIATTFDAFIMPIPAQVRRGAPLYVSGAAYQSGKKNLVYAVWTDLTGARGCKSASDEPFSNTASICKTRIWFTRSTDGGVRWAKPRMLNNQAAKNDQFMPALLVDDTTGALHLIYYDTVGEARTNVNVWYQSSFNDGVTWSAPFRITSTSSDGDGSFNGFQFGDYNALSGIAGTFFPSWTDRRSGVKEEIWTARIESSKSAVCQTKELLAAGSGTAAASVAVPEGATETRLSFWHQRRFASGLNAGSLAVSVDGGPAVAVPAAAILAGPGREKALFRGVDSSPVNTVVDLDAVCNAAAGGVAGCGGRTLRLFFSAGDVPADTPDRWLLDEVAVTACAP
ncbi:MAG TPA: sialidase family protein [Thermoanaerobaculia bacterium]